MADIPACSSRSVAIARQELLDKYLKTAVAEQNLTLNLCLPETLSEQEIYKKRSISAPNRATEPGQNTAATERKMDIAHVRPRNGQFKTNKRSRGTRALTLLSNDLFKKHLRKHENLLHKIHDKDMEDAKSGSQQVAPNSVKPSENYGYMDGYDYDSGDDMSIITSVSMAAERNYLRNSAELELSGRWSPTSCASEIVNLHKSGAFHSGSLSYNSERRRSSTTLNKENLAKHGRRDSLTAQAMTPLHRYLAQSRHFSTDEPDSTESVTKPTKVRIPSFDEFRRSGLNSVAPIESRNRVRRTSKHTISSTFGEVSSYSNSDLPVETVDRLPSRSGSDNALVGSNVIISEPTNKEECNTKHDELNGASMEEKTKVPDKIIETEVAQDINKIVSPVVASPLTKTSKTQTTVEDISRIPSEGTPKKTTLKENCISNLTVKLQNGTRHITGNGDVALKNTCSENQNGPQDKNTVKSLLKNLLISAQKTDQVMLTGNLFEDKPYNLKNKLKKQGAASREMLKKIASFEPPKSAKIQPATFTKQRIPKNCLAPDLEEKSKGNPVPNSRIGKLISKLKSTSEVNTRRDNGHVVGYGSDHVNLPVSHGKLQRQEASNINGHATPNTDIASASSLSLVSALNMKMKSEAAVLRTTSDACDTTTDSQKQRRERKERPYKSDPLSWSDTTADEKVGAPGMFSKETVMEQRRRKCSSTSSKDEILSFLNEVRRKGLDLKTSSSLQSLEEMDDDGIFEPKLDSPVENSSKCKKRNRLSNLSSGSADSGVSGSDLQNLVEVESNGPSKLLTMLLRRRGSNPSSLRGSVDGDALQKVSRTDSGSSQDYILTKDFPTEEAAYSSDVEKSEKEGPVCKDCGRVVDSVETEDSVDDVLRCQKCAMKRVERTETIMEIIKTEEDYGRDLNILKEEFYLPLKSSELLDINQLSRIFPDLDELILVNQRLTEKLHSAVANSRQQNAEELESVNIGDIFMEFTGLLKAFEKYCTKQPQGHHLLDQLEREKELLTVFLQVCQTENSRLRRMNLKSFLMTPVQRVTKYPLLLMRLHRCTSMQHPDRDFIKTAQRNIEDMLKQINMNIKNAGTLKHKQKQSDTNQYSTSERTEILKVAMELVGWSKKETCEVLMGKLHLSQPTDHTWAAKKCRHLKFSPVHGVLLTLGQPILELSTDHNLVFPQATLVRQASLILLRERAGRFYSVREPFLLDKVVITVDPDCDDVIELQEWQGDAYLLKGENNKSTALWVQHLKNQNKDLLSWRRRRNAWPNIMVKNMT